MRFNYSEVKKVVPNDTLYITIVREPGELFQSTFDFFYSITNAFHFVPHRQNNSAETWLDNAQKYWNKSRKDSMNHFSRNHVMFDLGYREDIVDDDEISKNIQNS